MLLGIDLGTSSIKAALIREDGRCLAIGAEPYAISTPFPGWAEQDAEDWVQATLRAVRSALAQAGDQVEAVAALSFSGQSHGGVCLGRHGEVLRPAIIWADQRSAQQVDEVRRNVGPENLARWTGNPLDTGFMLSTWLWLRQHEPEVAARAAFFVLPKDYVRYRLTGVLATEPSDAGTTGLFDPARVRWSQPLLEAVDIDPALLPDVIGSAAPAGRLLPQAAAEMGLAAGTPVFAGAADQACQALANGILAAGDVSSTIGTGGQLSAPTTDATPDSGLRLHLYNHVAPGLWFRMGATLSAGLSLTWLRNLLQPGTPFQQMADWANTAPAGSEGLFFVPHLAGERTPHMDPHARAAFIGLTLRHRREHIIRAVMEGVVFSLRQALDLMESLGVEARRVVASGGATQHPLWLQLQADIYDCPIHRTLTVEAAATGAALLAGIGVGVYGDAQDAASRTVRLHDEVILPQPEEAEHYRRAFTTYRDLYPALKAAS